MEATAIADDWVQFSMGDRIVIITARPEEDGRLRLRIEGAGKVERVVAWARDGKWVEVIA